MAQEMAVQLQSVGEEVAALVIMEAYLPPPAWERAVITHAGDFDPVIPDHVAEVIQAAGVGEVISDADVELLELILRNNEALELAHFPRKFHGDMLNIKSLDGKSNNTAGCGAGY